MSLTVDIHLERFSKCYHEGDQLRGAVQVVNTTGADQRHDAIIVHVDGTVQLLFNQRHASAFDALTGTAKQQPLLAVRPMQLAKAGYFTAGLNEFPFECTLEALRDPARLYETYHGLFVSVNYAVRCEVRPAGFLAKTIVKAQTFCVQDRALPPLPAARVAPVHFSMSPETMRRAEAARATSASGNGGAGGEARKAPPAVPRFLITGQLDRSEWCVARPVTGALTVQHTEMMVRSIDVQLVRVETSGGGAAAERTPSEATEIQTIQIADGNVCPKLQIPIYMVLPRLFVCPALKTNNFKVEFELNIIVTFKENHTVMENFKLPLNRFDSKSFLL